MNTQTNHGAAIPLPMPQRSQALLREFQDGLKRNQRLAQQLLEGSWENEPCTGVAARWCPIHGDCTGGEATDDGGFCGDWHCPLHGLQSQHAAIKP